jgi:hypothetical protein
MKNSMAPRSVRSVCDRGSKATFANVSHQMGDQKFIIEFYHALEGTISRWSRLHWQLLVLTNPHWVRVVGNGPFSL